MAEPLLAAVLAAVAVPCYAHRGGPVLHANAAMQRLAGRDAQALRQLDHAQLAAPDWHDALARYGQHCLHSADDPPAMELQLRHAQGADRPVEITARRLEIDGAPLVLVTCQDLSDIQHVQNSMLHLSQMLQQIVDGTPLATFVIDQDLRVTHWNRACQLLTGRAAHEMLGRDDTWRAFYAEPRALLAEGVARGLALDALAASFPGELARSERAPDTIEGEGFVPRLDGQGRWLHVHAAPLRDAEGRLIGAVQAMQDVTRRHDTEQELRRHREELERLVAERSAELRQTVAELQANLAQLQLANQKLEEAQHQLLQQDKMASIGQLAAGVAHEINNPIGFVGSNLYSLRGNVADLWRLIDAQQAALAATTAQALAANDAQAQPAERQANPALQALQAAQAVARAIDADYLREDLPKLLDESADGLARVKRIVQDLKDFSRVDQDAWQDADLNAGLESTLNVVMHEVKYKATVLRQLADLPPVRCIAAQLNQVFMNLIVNASQAIAERGTITLASGHVPGAQGGWVWVSVADTGCGMRDDVARRVFEPFFTTKPVGKGTGLGLSLSFSIVQRHGGVIRVRSQPGEGSRFTVWVPVAGPPAEGQALALPAEAA